MADLAFFEEVARYNQPGDCTPLIVNPEVSVFTDAHQLVKVGALLAPMALTAAKRDRISPGVVAHHIFAVETMF
jgi:hypothetical protein